MGDEKGFPRGDPRNASAAERFMRHARAAADAYERGVRRRDLTLTSEEINAAVDAELERLFKLPSPKP